MGQDKLSNRQKLELAAEAGLQAIPYVGSSLSTIYFGTKQLKSINRLERFYRDLRKDLDSLKDAIIPIEQHDPDALGSLIEKVNEKIECEHQERKFLAYKSYMKSLLLHPVNSTNYDKKAAFLEALNSMLILEIEMIVLFFQNSGKVIQVRSISKTGVDQYAIVGAISRLRTFGFIKPSNRSLEIGLGDNMLSESYTITSYGSEFVQFTLL